MVKRILNKYAYSQDLQVEEVKTMLMLAELLCKEWVFRKGKACRFRNFLCTELTELIRDQWVSHVKPKLEQR